MRPSTRSWRSASVPAPAGGSSPPRSSGACAGALPFDEWGPKVDGRGTPWEEWVDVPGLLDFLAAGACRLVFYTEWHNRGINWLDLVLREPA